MGGPSACRSLLPGCLPSPPGGGLFPQGRRTRGGSCAWRWLERWRFNVTCYRFRWDLRWLLSCVASLLIPIGPAVAAMGNCLRKNGGCERALRP